MARKWQEAQKRKHLYPNLKYLTVHDSHVRKEHAKLHGVVVPIDDPFWDTHYPPNDWRCRCYVQSTRDTATPKDKIPSVPVHKHFRHNVGKTGKIFDEKHPYFKHINDCKDKQPNAGLKDCKKRIFVEIEKLKLKFPLYKVRYQAKNGAKVYVNPFARNSTDFDVNYEIAKILADNGFPVKVPPYVNLYKYKNPDLFWKHYIDNYISDYNDVSKYIKSAFNQKYGKKGQLREFKESSIVIQIKKNDIINAARKLNGENKYWRKNKGVYVIIGSKAIKITKKDNYKTILNKMLKAIE